MHLGADTTWQQIAEGDIVGYTLMVHEHAEMEYFRRKRLDPFNYRDFMAYYEEAHAFALVEEHKIVPKSMDKYSVDMELTVGNG